MTPRELGVLHVHGNNHSAAPTGVGSALLSRRSVVRTAAHAAWAVPLVQVAAAAPALAASAGSLTAAAVINSWNGSGTRQTFTLTVTVTNTGNTSVALTSVTLSFPTGWNPTSSSLTTGWGVSGSGSATLSFTPSPARTLAAHTSATFTVTLNPVNNYVGTGTYVADGAGLKVIPASSTPGTSLTAAVIDVPGLYANLVITNLSAAWTRTGTTYYLPSSCVVKNRGRTATTTLEIAGTVDGLGTASGNPINVATGWTYQTTPDSRYVRTGSQLAAGQTVAFSTNRQMTGVDAGTSGTLTLTPRDAGTTNEVATAASVAVAAYA